MNPHDEVKRAEAAKLVLDSAVYKEAWASYEQILVNLWLNADTTEDKSKELRALAMGSRKARGHLERMMKDGAIAADQIRREEAAKKSFAARMFRAA